MLLVDMKIPSNCYECPFRDEDRRCGDTCNLTNPAEDIFDFRASRPEWCPLKEVKQLFSLKAALTQ